MCRKGALPGPGFPAPVQQGTGDADVEELDQRSHEEGRDNGADAHDFGYPAPCSAPQQEEGCAQQHTDQVGGDADVLETPPFPFMGHGDGHGVIGGDAQVRGHVQGAAHADHQDADQQEKHPEGEGGGGDPPLEGFQGELGDVAQKEQVDEGGDADVVAVEGQAEEQQHRVDDHIQGAEGNGNEGVQPAHQALEGIHSQGRYLEEAHGHGADHHAAQGHGHPAAVHLEFSDLHVSSGPPASRREQAHLMAALRPPGKYIPFQGGAQFPFAKYFAAGETGDPGVPAEIGPEDGPKRRRRGKRERQTAGSGAAETRLLSDGTYAMMWLPEGIGAGGGSLRPRGFPG